MSAQTQSKTYTIQDSANVNPEEAPAHGHMEKTGTVVLRSSDYCIKWWNNGGPKQKQCTQTKEYSIVAKKDGFYLQEAKKDGS